MLWIFPIFLTLSIVNSLPQEFNEQALTNDISTQNPDPNISDPSIAEDKCPNTLSDITTNTSPDEEAFTSTSPSVIKKRHHHEYCKQLQDDNLPAGPRTTPSEPVSQNPYKNVRYDSGDDNVCNLYGHMIPVTCGGPELLDIRTEEVNLWWSSYVVNCVPGEGSFFFWLILFGGFLGMGFFRLLLILSLAKKNFK